MKTDVSFKAKLSQDLYALRGISIFLVVIGHVIGNAKDVGIRQLYDSDIFLLTSLSGFIYTFHVPILFITAGMAFTIFSNKNNNCLNFVYSKFKTLFIPLLCWSPLCFIFQSIVISKSFSVFDVVSTVIHPYFIFWFFHALIFATLFAFFFLRAFKSHSMYLLVSVILFFISFHLKIHITHVWFDWNLFYCLGVYMALYLPKINLLIKSFSTTVTLLIIFFCLFTMFADYYFIAHDYSLMAKCINGILAFICLYIILLQRKKILLFNQIFDKTINKFIYLGKNSMSIYLFHIYFGTGVRVFLVKFLDIKEPGLHFIIGCFAGIFGPIVVYNFLRTRSKIFMYSIGEVK